MNRISQGTRLKFQIRWLHFKLGFSNVNGIHMKSSLYSDAIQFCIKNRANYEGRLVHSHLISSGYGSNSYLNTQMIIFYSKVGDMENARKVFDRMSQRSVVSWTALLSGYSQNDSFEDALMVLSAMHRCGVKANEFSYGSGLRACTGIRCLERGKQLQGWIYKCGFSGNLFVQSALIDLNSKCGDMEDAYHVFEIMAERDLVAWNAMIDGYASQGFMSDCFQMFHFMLSEGLQPDCFTLGSVMKALAGGGDLMRVDQVHSFIIQVGFTSDSFVVGLLIDAYAKCGNLRSASDLYKSIGNKDLISCTSLINGYAREGNHFGDALDLFFQINKVHVGLDDVILCSMLNLCADVASLSLGKQIHALGLKCRPHYDVAMGNALVDMYAKSGDIVSAHSAFVEMGKKNVITWTSMIVAYARHGYGAKAIALYREMECAGLNPNEVTFLALLFACSHSGMTREGWECFNNMIGKYNILPKTEHYTCLVDLFARGGMLEEAYNLMIKMETKLNSSVWASVLGACDIYGNVCLGEIAALELFRLEPEKSVNYVVLASIYCRAGLWNAAGRTRKLMGEKKIEKNPGCSFIEYGDNTTLLL